MKHFITPKLRNDGRRCFEFQMEGFGREHFLSVIQGKKIVAYLLYPDHSLEEAWGCAFLLDDGMCFDFSSASTYSVGWDEVGTLNISFQKYSDDVQEGRVVHPIAPLRLIGIDLIVFEDDDIYVECGLCFCGEGGAEIVVAAGVSPGSVTVGGDFLVGHKFVPLFPLSGCRRVFSSEAFPGGGLGSEG